MKIFDISQELRSCNRFPGQEPAEHYYMETIEGGSVCNITHMGFNVHVGTHMDAPYHFINDGMDIASIPLSKCVTQARVAKFDTDIDVKDLAPVLADAPGALLFKGEGRITLAAAKAIAAYGIQLVGVQHQAVGLPEEIVETHHALLGHDVVILEGLVLDEVPEGDYLLCAQPIKIAGGDGAPVRAILIKM